MRFRPAGIAGALLAVALGGGRAVAAPDVAREIDRIDGVVTRLEDELQAIERDLDGRRGLIGGDDAVRRYQDGLYAWMLGDDGTCARTFFILVESRALEGSPLGADARWYLGECFRRMGSDDLALEAYRAIVDRGPDDPYYADAVRMQLEIHGMRGDAEAFYRLYDEHVASGDLEPTDAVRYSLGKALYLQGELHRAFDLLEGIPVNSPYHGRARYLMGTIRLLQDRREEALPLFAAASEISIATQEDRDVVDLANLAQARLAYGAGRLDDAVTFYQRIDRNSRWFSDALYELVWTWIAAEDYQDALLTIDIFLLAFPDDRATAWMRLTQGHLERRLAHFERALAAYDRVAADYAPLEQEARRMADPEAVASTWFDELARARPDRPLGPLPAYAVARALEEPDLQRALEVYREVDRQAGALEDAAALIGEIQKALAASGATLGAFQEQHARLDRANADILQVYDELLALQEAWLMGVLPGARLDEVRALQERRLALARRSAGFQQLFSSGADQLVIYDQQVRAVQDGAAQVLVLLDEVDTQARMLRTYLASGAAEVDPDDRRLVEQELDRLARESREIRRKVAEIRSDATRQAMLEPLRRSLENADPSRTARALAQEFKALREAYLRLAADAPDRRSAAEFANLWARLDGLDTIVAKARVQVDEAERRELVLVRVTLDEQVAEVASLSDAVGATHRDARALGELAVSRGLEVVADAFAQAVLEADMGKVDVYWLEKTTTAEERKAVAREREEALNDLAERFGIIRTGIEGGGGS